MDTDDPPPWVSRCPRCTTTMALDDGVTGCAVCAADGRHAAGAGAYRHFPTGASRAAPAGVGAMWRWCSHLVPVGAPVSLGEGGTPLVGLDLDGVPGRVLLKDERANPTGSFKDRLASAVVSRARHRGADTVVVSSSGNAGIAVGAYAAAAGLQATAAWQACASGGVLLELSSAAAAHGAAVLAERGAVGRRSTVVLLGTAGPYAQQTLAAAAAGRRIDDPADPAAVRAAAEGDR